MKHALNVNSFQVYNSSSNANGVIFVLDDQSALSVDGRSSKGDPVETKSLTSDSDEVGYSWAIRNEEIIDAVAYPVTFVSEKNHDTRQHADLWQRLQKMPPSAPQPWTSQIRQHQSRARLPPRSRISPSPQPYRTRRAREVAPASAAWLVPLQQ